MRKAKPKKRYILPVPNYQDTLVTKFVNNLMMDGKKSISYTIFYDAIKQVEDKTGENGLETWKTALSNIMPSVEVKSRRVGGSTFQIPTPVSSRRKITLGCNWLIGFSKKRNGKSMADKLASEMVAASKGEGAAVKKREDTHKMAEANKAFSHFRV